MFQDWTAHLEPLRKSRWRAFASQNRRTNLFIFKHWYLNRKEQLFQFPERLFSCKTGVRFFTTVIFTVQQVYGWIQQAYKKYNKRMKEYNRRMKEYNRHTEEYNRRIFVSGRKGWFWKYDWYFAWGNWKNIQIKKLLLH